MDDDFITMIHLVFQPLSNPLSFKIIRLVAIHLGLNIWKFKNHMFVHHILISNTNHWNRFTMPYWIINNNFNILNKINQRKINFSVHVHVHFHSLPCCCHEITTYKFAHNYTTSIQSQKVLNADKSTHAHKKMLNDNKNMDVRNQCNILLLGKVESYQP